MGEIERRAPRHSNSYEIFILVITILSLAIMALLVLPWIDDETKNLLTVYDNLICIVFLIDFAMNVRGTRPRRDYFIGRRGWLDLLGSIPSFGILRITALLRLARLSRLARITRLLRGQNQKELVRDIVQNRGQYAIFITLLAALIVLVVSSVAVLQFESKSLGANIKSGGDALWWAIVTITTVGYGDFYPVTALGRLTGVFVMFTGVGIIGALASILASVLVPQPDETAAATKATEEASRASEEAERAASTELDASGDVARELAAIRAELAALRVAMGDKGAETAGPG